MVIRMDICLEISIDHIWMEQHLLILCEDVHWRISLIIYLGKMLLHFEFVSLHTVASLQMSLKLLLLFEIAQAAVASHGSGMSLIAVNGHVLPADKLLEVKDQTVVTLVKEELHILLKLDVCRRTAQDGDPFILDAHQGDMGNLVDIHTNFVAIDALPVADERNGHGAILGHSAKVEVGLNVGRLESTRLRTRRDGALSIVSPTLRVLKTIPFAIGLQLIGNHAASEALKIFVLNVEHAVLVLNPLWMRYIAPTSLIWNNVGTESRQVPQRHKGELCSVNAVEHNATRCSRSVVDSHLDLC